MIKPPLFTFCSVIALAAAAPVYAGVVPSAGASNSVQGIADREITRRNDQVARAQQAIAEGDAAINAKDYETAVQRYKAASDILPESPVTHKLRSAAVERYCIASVKLAEQQIAEGNFGPAEATAKAVLDPAYNPQYGPARALLAHLKEPGYYNKTITPAFHAKVENVKALLVEGEGYYQSGQFDKAEKSYNQILAIDKTNSAAREGLERVDKARTEYGDIAYRQTREHMMQQVLHGWELPVPRYSKGTKILATGSQNVGGTVAIQEKLNKIIIPKVEFKDATVREAIDFLKMKSRELDIHEPDPSRRGVNIVLQLNDPTGGAAPAGGATGAPADPNAPAIPGLDANAGGAAAATPAPAATPGTNPITLSLNNVPMAEVLRYITAAAGLKIKIDPYAVSVVPLTAIVETLITKEYKVPPGTFTTTGGAGAASAPVAAAPTAGGNGAMTAGNMGQRVAAKDYFANLGVQFPPGTSATFIPNGSRLIVKNTQEQLDLIDTLVEALNGQAPSQVDIEAKFVEITQTNLKELSFDWTLGQFNIPGSNKVFGGGGTVGNGNSSATSNYPFVDPAGNIVGTNPLTSGNRTGSTAISSNAIDALLFPATGSSTAAPGILSAAGVFTDPQFQVVLRALNQKKGVDLLSSPRVTCKSGQEAEISIVREFKYPTEYNPPQVPTSGSSTMIAVTPTTPTAFDVKQTGVLLHVQPTVGADGSTIDLQLEPQVVEFEGFINYGTPIYGSNGVTSSILTDNVINQPIFSTRKVRTNVSVWDGQTVMLGGLMREDVQKVEDKVPFLGDVPFVGRLFRSSVDQHSKRNLVIFVTARLINPAGDPINVSDEEKDAADSLVPAPGAADTAPMLAPLPK
ncbi:MAG: type II and III secretion system protein [Chthoniobacteraceae bacterium]|nr:type II and III secretion system protein [Chthoniobacteraceae bacterium]